MQGQFLRSASHYVTEQGFIALLGFSWLNQAKSHAFTKLQNLDAYFLDPDNQFWHSKLPLAAECYDYENEKATLGCLSF
jgi:hypothetical protein